MITASSRFIGVVLLLVSVAPAQQDQSTKPLGDVAREQQQARKQQGKASASRIYGDIDVVAESAKSGETPKPSHGSEGKDAGQIPTPVLLEKTPKIKLVRRSVLDQAKNKQPDFITVPAGTEIRVDIVEGKVVVPVRVGFATPIPALSNAAVRVNPVYYAPVFYSVVSGTTGNTPVAYGETADLTAVTVRGVTYPVQANAVPLDAGSAIGGARSLMSPRDTVFVLSAPLIVER